MGSTEQFRKGYTPWNKGLHGEENPKWKGGMYQVYENGKTFNISRKIAENVLGRPLKTLEFVHHINFNPRDNRRENLLICDRGYHKGLHNKIRFRGLVNYFKSLPGGELYLPIKKGESDGQF